MQATVAEINRPSGIALDGTGNLFIADQYNNVIRKVDPTGIISTIAGTGIGGYSGDGLAATIAQLNAPAYITTDDCGNLYISDVFNYRIRKIDPAGIIGRRQSTGGRFHEYLFS